MKKSADKQHSSTQFYAHLIIYRKVQFGLGLMVILAIGVFSYLIAQDLFLGKTWLTIGTPLFFLGLLFLLYPPTEQWDYRPWQAKAQTYEKHFWS